VVATGIDAEMVKLPEKVHTLRPHLKPQPFRIESARPIVNPVQAQVESLAAELNAPSMAEPLSPIAKEAPLTEEPVVQGAAAAVRYPATESYRPLEQQPLAHRPRAEKKGGLEPVRPQEIGDPGHAGPSRLPRNVPAPPPRPMQRPVTQEQPLTPPPGEDLFPTMAPTSSSRFPAFLRRQSN